MGKTKKVSLFFAVAPIIRGVSKWLKTNVPNTAYFCRNNAGCADSTYACFSVVSLLTVPAEHSSHRMLMGDTNYVGA